MAGDLRAAVQAARRGQVEYPLIAAHLQENGRKFAQPRGFFRHPQGVGDFAYVGDEKIARREAAEAQKARCIGEPRLRESLSRADPQHGSPRMPPPGQARHAQCEPGCRTGIARVAAMDFGERGIGQATAECDVQTLGSRPECVG